MSVEQPEIDISKLPSDVRARLAKLELELSEGDITQKGYDKKRQALLAPFMHSQKNGGSKSAASPTTRAHRKQQRRLTRNESRYHSEIRQEAVQQALAEWKSETNKEPKKIPVQPLKRRTLQKRTNKAELSDSSSDDDSTLESSGTASGSERRKTKESTPLNKLRNGVKKENSQPPRGASCSRDDDETKKQKLLEQRRKRNQQQNKRSSVLLDANSAPVRPPPNGVATNGTSADYQNLTPKSPSANGHAIAERPLPRLPPEATVEDDDEDEGGVVVDDEEDAVYINTRIPLARRTDGGTSTNDSGIGGSTADGLPQDYANARLPLKPTRVSQKIQQLLQTLQVGFA